MGLDVPEILIILGILGIVAWAAYNKLHEVGTHRHGR